MAYKRKESNEDIKERVRARGKKFVSYAEGAELYSVGIHTFQKMAKEAGARAVPYKDCGSSYDEGWLDEICTENRDDEE